MTLISHERNDALCQGEGADQICFQNCANHLEPGIEGADPILDGGSADFEIDASIVDEDVHATQISASIHHEGCNILCPRQEAWLRRVRPPVDRDNKE